MAVLSKIYRIDKISFLDAKKYYYYVRWNPINSIIKNYFKDNFDIDIDNYSDDELKVIIEQLSNCIDKRIKEEQARN